MNLKIAVAGCGPAGLTAAIMLSGQGHEVTLFERFASPRPIGSGIILQPTGLAVLRDLGLHDDIHALGKRIDRIHGVSMPSCRQVLNVDYSVLGDDYHGLAVHRAALFDVLYDKAQRCDLTVCNDVDVRNVICRDQAMIVVDQNHETHDAFDIVVDASGSGTRLRPHSVRPTRLRELAYGALWGAFDWPKANFDSHTLEQRYVGAHTMIGVLPMGRHAGVANEQVAFFWSVKTHDYDRWLQDGLESWKASVLGIWPETDVILDQITAASDMALAKYGHCTLRMPFGHRIAFLGDAAHSTSPQLGQGANMALLDAWALSRAVEQCHDVPTALKAYAASRRWHVIAFQATSLALTPFYQSDSRVLALLRDALFNPAAKLPVARRIVAGLVSGMLGRLPKGLRV